MGNITKKQHWIPQFIIKKWTNENNEYNFYDTKNKNHNIGNLKDSDIFYHDYLYENEKLFKFNEIENGLSQIENDFAKILDNKILIQNDIVAIKRIDSKIIKLYWLLEIHRSWTNPEKAYNLKGTPLFNDYFKNKTKTEINKEFLERLHYLVFDIFEYIKSNVGFIPEKLQIKLKEHMNDIDLVAKGKKIELTKINHFELENFILYNLLSTYSSTCLKIIKIKKEITYNFLLTDSRQVQFFGESYSKIYGWPILEIMPISPRYAIALLKLNDLDYSKPSAFAKNSFWEKKFPGLFVVNHEKKIYRKKEYISELNNILAKNPKLKENKESLNIFKKRLIMNYFTNEDWYHYPIYELITKEQVHLINAMLHSQTYKYVAYLKRKDLLKAIETIKFYDIYRIEDRDKRKNIWKDK